MLKKSVLFCKLIFIQISQFLKQLYLNIIFYDKAEMALGLRVMGHRVSDFGRIGSRVSVSDPVFDPVLSFNMRVYRGVVSTEQHHLGKLISAISVLVRFQSQHYWFTYFS